MTAQNYVPHGAWLRTVGRPDLIDEIADQFERPAVPAPQAIRPSEPGARWPRTPRGWRSRDLFTHRISERHAV